MPKKKILNKYMSKEQTATQQFLGVIKQLLQSQDGVVVPHPFQEEIFFDFRRTTLLSPNGKRFDIKSVLNPQHAELSVKETWQLDGTRRVFGVRYNRRPDGKLEDATTFFEDPFRREWKSYFEERDTTLPSLLDYPLPLSDQETETFCQEIIAAVRLKLPATKVKQLK